jgi:hypothetical protein
LNRRSAIALIVTAVLIATASAILLSIASIGGFDPSKRVISDPIEGTETQAVENPALPDHPGFPPPSTNNLPSTAEATSNSFAKQTLVKAPTVAIIVFGISK